MRSFLVRRVLVLVAVAAVGLATGGAASAAKYVVVYKGSVPADAERRIAKSGGTLVASYDAIGVAVASSRSDTFEAALSQDSRI